MQPVYSYDPSSGQNAILDVKDLNVWFPVTRGLSLFSRKIEYLHAVDGISFQVKQVGEGEIFCLVGESGSGKTTTGFAIVHLAEPTSGKIVFEGTDISLLKKFRNLKVS